MVGLQTCGGGQFFACDCAWIVSQEIIGMFLCRCGETGVARDGLAKFGGRHLFRCGEGVFEGRQRPAHHAGFWCVVKADKRFVVRSEQSVCDCFC